MYWNKVRLVLMLVIKEIMAKYFILMSYFQFAKCVFFFFSKFSHCLRYRCIGVWREKYIPQPICLDLGSGEEVGRIQLPNVHDFWIKKTIPLPHKTNPEAIIVSKCYILKMTTLTMRVGRNDKEMAVSQRK